MQKKDAKAIAGRVTAFLKKNIHYILMILCVIAIGVVVTVVAVVNKNQDVDVVNPEPKPPVVKPDDTDKPTIEKKFALTMPVVGGEYGRVFSDKELSFNVTLGRYDAHLALDVVGKVGSNVVAGFDGVVLSVEKDNFNGGVVTIDYGKGYVGVIKLLDSVSVKKGDSVKENTVIGKVGAFQFECKEKDHIHFELKYNNKLVDPKLYIVGQDK